MPIQMKKGGDQILAVNVLQTYVSLEQGLSMSVGKPYDVNTRDKTITGDFFKITVPVNDAFGGTSADAFGNDRVSSFYLHPANNNVYGQWNIYWKPAGASYYKEGPDNWVQALDSVRVYFDFDAGRSLALGFDNDLNTKRTTITGDFLKVRAVGLSYPERGMLEIDGNRVSELYMSADGSKFYYKPRGASYYRETGPNNFLIVYDDKVTTSVLDHGLKISRPGSIFNDVQLYPNPANGTVNLKFDLSGNNAEVRVTNQLGQEVLPVQTLQGEGQKVLQLDVSGLSSGIYYVKLHDNTGHQTIMPLSVVK